MTIPIALSVLLPTIGGNGQADIDKWPIMCKIGWSVLLPLLSGLFIKHRVRPVIMPIEKRLQMLNQMFVLAIVWMALSQSRQAIVQSGEMAGIVFGVVFFFHGVLLTAAFFLTKLCHLRPGQRESVILMAAKKRYRFPLFYRCLYFLITDWF